MNIEKEKQRKIAQKQQQQQQPQQTAYDSMGQCTFKYNFTRVIFFYYIFFFSVFYLMSVAENMVRFTICVRLFLVRSLSLFTIISYFYTNAYPWRIRETNNKTSKSDTNTWFKIRPNCVEVFESVNKLKCSTTIFWI